MSHHLTYRLIPMLILGCLGCGDSPAPRPAVQSSNPVRDVATSPAPTAEAPVVAHEAAVPDEHLLDPVTASGPATPDAAAEAFETLSSLTASPEEWERSQQTIVEHGADSIPVLVEALQSDDAFRRETSSSLLAMLGPDAAPAKDALLAALQDESIYVRANAATALCTLPGHDEQAMAVFIELLGSNEPHLQQMAAMNLANFGKSAAPYADRIAAAVKDAPADVSQPVIQLLQQLSEEGAETSAVQAEFVDD